MAYSATPGAIIRIGVDGAAASRREIDTVARTMSNLSATVQNAMRSLAASVGIGAGVAGIVQMSDEYAKFTAQLRLATQSQREYGAAYADVKRIANDAQQGLASTGVLYARIANGTRELGTTQRQVADITEVVNMALKVSGATASEAASAQLQLSQAFASGTLRGEEFNAVNEAAPRLMLALADGIGVPVGALKKMAEDGEITSKIMADVLPKALGTLREEARHIQTIGGAFTELKNNVMEFTGMQAQASGAVSIVTGAIGGLANNLGLAIGAVAVFVGGRLLNFLSNAAERSTATASVNRALAVSNVEVAKANAVAAVQASNVANARLAEIRTATLAASGNAQLALTTNALIPAQARATVATGAKTAALAQLAIAQRAASLGAAALAAGTTALNAALALTGGPLGLLVTVLGIAALAWSHYGDKAKEANDKAKIETEKSTQEIVDDLRKQNEKLRDRIELSRQAGMKGAAQQGGAAAERQATLLRQILELQDSINRGTAGPNGSVRLIELQYEYTDLANAMEQVASSQQTLASGSRAEDIKEWYGQHGTAAQKLEYELEGLRKKFGTIPPEMEKLIRAKYVDKGAAALVRQEATAYATLMTSIKEKIAANELEAAGYATLSDAQKMTIQLDAAIGAGKNKLSKDHIDAARAQIAVVAAQDAALLSAKNVKAATEELEKDRNSAYESAMAEVLANEELVATYGMTKLQIEQLTLARLEDRLAQRAALELDEKEVAQLERMIAAKRRNMTAVGKLDVLERGSDLTKAKELLDIMTSIDEVTRSAAVGMAESFGRVGSAIGDMTTALSGYGRAQASIAAQLAADKAAAKNDPVKLKAAEVRATQAAAVAQVRQYGDMAKAAKGFFKENTAGYKVMEGAEKAFRAYEMAMSIKSMVEKSGLLTAFTGLFVTSKATQTAAEGTATAASTTMAGTQASAWGVTAVVKAIASMPFPLNIAAGAATLAAVVAIGAKMMGSVGGGSVSLSEQRQASQGTGTVLGSSSAKSESIARSIELSAANSSIELNYTQGMLRSLLSIESSMKGLGNLLVRGSGVTGEMAANTKGSAVKFVEGAGSVLTGTRILDAFTNGWFSKVSGKITNAVFGGNVSTLDTGITANKGSLASIAAGGIRSSQYTDTKRDGGWFRSDKYSTNLQGLGAEADLQFTKIVTNMAGAVREAGKLLEQDGNAFNERLAGFVVDIGKVSLKGLSGEQIQEQLEAVFSKLGDDMAKYAIGGLAQFQEVGEGYLETLVRISANYANLDATLQSIGMTFGAAGLSSIAAREDLIRMAGGIDELAGKAASFGQNFLTEQERLAPLQKYVTDQMAKMNLAHIDTREEFKNHVLGLKLVTEAERLQFAQLMDLESAFAKVTAQAKDLSRSTQDIADERADLQDQWDELTMTSAQLHAKARLAIDPSNRALFDQIALQRDLKASTEAASDALKSTVERLGATQASTVAYRDSLLLGSLSTLTPMQKYLETQRQYNAAIAKAAQDPADSAAASAAQSAATAFLTASQVINASSAAFLGDKSKVLNDMDRLAAIAGVQMTDAQRQLSALDKQVVGIAQLNDTAAAIQQAIVNQAGPGPMVAPAFDVQRYAASSNAAAGVLADEVKALRADNVALKQVLEAVLAETKLFRLDSNRNAGDLMDVTEGVGATVAKEVGGAVEHASYLVRNPTRVAPR